MRPFKTEFSATLYTYTLALSLSICALIIPINSELHAFSDVRSIRCRKIYSNTTHKFRMCGQLSLMTSKAALSTMLLMHILQ